MKTEYQKLPPQCIEAEESILATALLGKARDISELLEPDEFYRTAHQKIFRAITELVESDTEVDLTMVVSRLRDQNKLEECGGAAYIAKLLDTPVSISIKDHVELIKSSKQKRLIIEICNNTIKSCYNGQSTEKILGDHEMYLANIKTHSGNFYKLGDLLEGMMEYWESIMKNPELPGIPSGLIEVDKKFGGFKGKNLYVIGARPGMGKSALCARICRGAAQKGFPSLQLHLEMSKESVVTREVSCQSGVDGERFLTGDLQSNHWLKIADACGRIDPMPLYVDDSPRSTIAEIQSKARQFVRKYGHSMILVDYLGYVKGVESDRKDLEIGTITKGLKAISKDLDVPVVLFVQLNRKCEDRTDKRPLVSDLRNSGEIEQDADVIAFIYREELYNKDTEKKGVAEFIVRKHRHGKPGTVYLTWIGFRTTFENQAKP